MSGILGWIVVLLLNPPREAEMSETLAPPGWQGNYYGPEATKARQEGRMAPIVMTPHMARWDRWGRQNLKSGDVVFRMGDARLAHGYFRISRFLAKCSNSRFSHTGIASIEDGEVVVYDTTRTGVARQPFCVWVLDNVGDFGVRRVKPEYNDAIPKVIAYLHKVYEDQLPFDYELDEDDKALYCVEMTEKAYRAAGLKLSDPVRLGDMERATEFPTAASGSGVRITIPAQAPADAGLACLLSRQRAPRNLVGQTIDDGRSTDMGAGLPQHDGKSPGRRGAIATEKASRAKKAASAGQRSSKPSVKSPQAKPPARGPDSSRRKLSG